MFLVTDTDVVVHFSSDETRLQWFSSVCSNLFYNSRIHHQNQENMPFNYYESVSSSLCYAGGIAGIPKQQLSASSYSNSWLFFFFFFFCSSFSILLKNTQRPGTKVYDPTNADVNLVTDRPGYNDASSTRLAARALSSRLLVTAWCA